MDLANFSKWLCIWQEIGFTLKYHETGQYESLGSIDLSYKIQRLSYVRCEIFHNVNVIP